MQTSKEQSLQVPRGPRGRFQKGFSGNPKGRKPGSVNKLLKQMRDAAEKVALPLLIEKAKEGDVKAATFLCQLGLPKTKPVAVNEPIILEGDSPSDVVNHVLSGGLSIEEGKALAELLKMKRNEELLEGSKGYGVLMVPEMLTESEWNEKVKG